MDKKRTEAYGTPVGQEPCGDCGHPLGDAYYSRVPVDGGCRNLCIGCHVTRFPLSGEHFSTADTEPADD
jgi:hypothetical protein